MKIFILLPWELLCMSPVYTAAPQRKYHVIDKVKRVLVDCPCTWEQLGSGLPLSSVSLSSCRVSEWLRLQ